MKISRLNKFVLIGFVGIVWSSVDAQESQNLIHQGNQKLVEESYAEAESKYRKAVSNSPQQIEGVFNLGNVHYRSEDYQEASQRFLQTQILATSKEKRHQAFHNLGNSFMKKKDYPRAVEAYKNALRNNPKDDETRYNYALAKSLLEQERQQEDQSNQDQEDQDQEQNDQSEQDQENQDQNNQSEDDSSDQNQDDGQNQPENQSEQNQQDQQNQNPQQPQQSRLSPQQIKNLLEAMDNQEKNVQEKINAQRVRGTSQSARKDW